jgi:hypothetical protein
LSCLQKKTRKILQVTDEVSIRACQYTGAVSIRPLKNGNIMMRQAGVSIYRKTHLSDAFKAISKECGFPESLETEVRGNINFQRLPM